MAQTTHKEIGMVHRRDFLKLTAGVATGALCLPSAFSATPMEKKTTDIQREKLRCARVYLESCKEDLPLNAPVMRLAGHDWGTLKVYDVKRTHFWFYTKNRDTDIYRVAVPDISDISYSQQIDEILDLVNKLESLPDKDLENVFIECHSSQWEFQDWKTRYAPIKHLYFAPLSETCKSPLHPYINHTLHYWKGKNLFFIYVTDDALDKLMKHPSWLINPQASDPKHPRETFDIMTQGITA